MNSKIKSFREVCLITREAQAQGKKVVFVHGFFDILHKGHGILLTKAKKLGDILVVGVDHDDNAKIIKGPNRPFFPHRDRIFLLSLLEPVDYLFLIPSFISARCTTPDAIHQFMTNKIYYQLRPDIVATCVRAGKHGSLKRSDTLAIGAKFVNINHPYSGLHASDMIKLLASQN